MDKQTIKDLKTSAKITTQMSARFFLHRATWDRLNGRRHELIHLKYDTGLRGDDMDEYELLDQEAGRLMNLAFPHDFRFSEELKSLLAKYNQNPEDPCQSTPPNASATSPADPASGTIS